MVRISASMDGVCTCACLHRAFISKLKCHIAEMLVQEMSLFD